MSALRLRRVLGLLLAAAASCGTAVAQDAKVRARLASDDPVWVGQEVTLVVELLAPGYFASAASFDLPDPAGVLLMPPSTHPQVDSETIDDTRYALQRHELRAWPMRAGQQSIPALTVRFSFKRQPLDTDTVPAAVTTRALPLAVRQPPGAEQLGTVISARQLEVEEIWKPEPGTGPVKAGTAFTRTITFEAPDVPGMVFPSFPAPELDGLGVYAKHGVRDRQDDDGALVGVRRDEITYVCERPGEFTIPAATYTWFDLASKTLRTKTLPARTLKVIANPAMAAAGPTAHGSAAPAPRPWSQAVGALLLLVVLLLTGLTGRVRRLLARALAPFRPVRLQPLNPTDVTR